jgi:hypothetical protein
MYFRFPVTLLPAGLDQRLRMESGEAPRIADRKTPAGLRALACAFAAIGLTGCLYTTHHFNSGRLLEPGQTAVTIGAGRARFYSDQCPDGYYRERPEAGGQDFCRYSGNNGPEGFGTGIQTGPDSIVPLGFTTLSTPKMSLGYRLGVRKRWGPLTGIEMGWSLEVPTNPATVEFDLKAGLPLPSGWKAAHSLSAGWGVGMWADNTLFLEYAASRSFGPHALYANYRFSWLASQPQDLDSSFNNWKFVSHRRTVHQAALGYFHRLPDIILLPDFVSPEFVLTYPLITPFATSRSPLLDKYQLNFNFGFGWNF